MQKIIYILVFSCCFLMGCQPPEQLIFGVPQSQWNQLTPTQQDAVIQGYNQRMQTAAQNAPLESAIGTAGLILQQNKQS